MMESIEQPNSLVIAFRRARDIEDMLYRRRLFLRKIGIVKSDIVYSIPTILPRSKIDNKLLGVMRALYLSEEVAREVQFTEAIILGLRSGVSLVVNAEVSRDYDKKPMASFQLVEFGDVKPGFEGPKNG